jgi:hypothetical protein
VGSEAVGKHEVSGDYGWLQDVGWRIEERMLSADAHKNHRQLKHWWSTGVIYFVQFALQVSW